MVGQHEAAVDPAPAAVVVWCDQVVALLALAGAEDAAKAIAAARRAFDSGEWPNTPAPERAALLAKLADLLERQLPAGSRVLVWLAAKRVSLFIRMLLSSLVRFQPSAGIGFS